MTQDTPKPRQEVVEETRETLEVMELDRAPRPQKLAREQAFLEGADEVSYHERGFKPRHPASLDEIRTAIDELTTQHSLRVAPLPPAPAPPTPMPVPADQWAALAGVMPGTLVSVETIYHVVRGEVVEATFDHEGAMTKGIFLLREGSARPMNDIETRIDALPTPAVRDSPEKPRETAPEPAEAPPTAIPREKRRGFARFRGDPKEPAEPTTAPRSSAGEAPKRKFSFGRKKI